MARECRRTRGTSLAGRPDRALVIRIGYGKPEGEWRAAPERHGIRTRCHDRILLLGKPRRPQGSAARDSGGGGLSAVLRALLAERARLRTAPGSTTTACKSCAVCTTGVTSPKRAAIWPLGSPNGQANTPSSPAGREHRRDADRFTGCRASAIASQDPDGGALPYRAGRHRREY